MKNTTDRPARTICRICKPAENKEYGERKVESSCGAAGWIDKRLGARIGQNKNGRNQMVMYGFPKSKKRVRQKPEELLS